LKVLESRISAKGNILCVWSTKYVFVGVPCAKCALSAKGNMTNLRTGESLVTFFSGLSAKGRRVLNCRISGDSPQKGISRVLVVRLHRCLRDGVTFLKVLESRISAKGNILCVCCFYRSLREGDDIFEALTMASILQLNCSRACAKVSFTSGSHFHLRTQSWKHPTHLIHQTHAR